MNKIENICAYCGNNIDPTKDSFYNLNGVLYHHECFEHSTYYKIWQKSISDRARPYKILFMLLIIIFVFLVTSEIIKILSYFM